jgi:Leucine-rich repeat (LRR) protein
VLNLKGNRLRRISNLGHLKQLRYLKLIRNRISAIEGLTGCLFIQEIYLRKSY